uniref:Uncharacterized protein n=1 Tax=Acrobeloides nanus TaxID=290746 RepID=A0A914DDR1_9BILA
MKSTTLLIFVAIFVLAVQFMPADAQYWGGYGWPYYGYGYGYYGYGKREAGFDSNGFNGNNNFHARNLRGANAF